MLLKNFKQYSLYRLKFLSDIASVAKKFQSRISWRIRSDFQKYFRGLLRGPGVVES